MLLTIAIPTFNRSCYLKENLNALIPQVVGYIDNIEIIISDNCSTDETKEVVYSYMETCPQIRYYRQRENVGLDRNFKWCIDNANGEYVYVMGDDDIISPNFIDIIMPILESKEHYTIIHWNRLTGDADCNNNKLVDRCFIGSPIEVLEVKELIWRVMDFPNFISSVIFLKAVFEIDTQSYNPQYEGYYIFAQMYLGALQIGGSCLYYYFPLIIQRNPSKTWKQYWPQYFFSSMSNIFSDIEEKVPGVYTKWLNKMHENSSSVLSFVALYRAYYRQKAVREIMIKHMTTVERYRYYYYLCIPGSFLLYSVKRKILKFVNKQLG